MSDDEDRRIHLSRMSPDERERLEKELMKPGATYREAAWRKTAPESIDEIESKVDEITGRADRTRYVKTDSAEPGTRTSSTDLPPGLRSRLSKALGPLAYVNLVYATKEHMICRVGLREDLELHDVIVLVGPDRIQQVDSVLEAIDELTAGDRDIIRELDHLEEEVDLSHDPFGDIDPVRDVEGIGDTYGRTLEDHGIETTQDLWHAEAQTLADKLDASQTVVERWQQQAELMAISGIGPQYAELLVRCGITTIEQLADSTPEGVVEAVDSKQAQIDVNIQGNRITQKVALRWINLAREHLGKDPLAIEAVTEDEETTVTVEIETEGPFGDIDPILDVEGIGDVYGEGLKELGIETTQDLWHADTETVAEALDISPKVVTRWQDQAELMAVDGIGPQYAELLVRSGITGIEELAASDPEDVLDAIEAKQAELKVRIQGTDVTLARVRTWVDLARNHDA